MESVILITKRLCSGLSSLNIVVVLHESKSPIFDRSMYVSLHDLMA